LESGQSIDPILEFVKGNVKVTTCRGNTIELEIGSREQEIYRQGLQIE